MKLNRIRVEQLRQFRQPIELRDLAPGLNLFTGPNEAGKSTLVAAIRAAFFERHRSGSVDDLRPWGDSAAAPTVEIGFELGGQPCRLVKTFLARKRCELEIGRDRLDGEEAENRLAELLGYQHAGRGASKAEHWGIPGLLWISQGSAHELHEAVGHATDHLRNALEQSLGEVAASGGDEILDKVRTLRNAVLTESGGKPRGSYKEALDRVATLSEAIRALDERIGRYRERVDGLARLRAAHAADEAEKPWLAFRSQEREAATRLATARGLQTELDGARERRTQAEARIGLLRNQFDAFAREQALAEQRAAALAEAEQACRVAAAPVEAWRSRYEQAVHTRESARRVLKAARQRELHQGLLREAGSCREGLAACRARRERAEAAQQKVTELERRLAASEIAAADLTRLRTQDRALADLRLQQATAATRLVYRLSPGSSLAIGDATITGQGARELIDAATLHLPDLGEIDIVPGGADLPALRARCEDLADAQRALLARLGLTSLDEAEARVIVHQRLAEDLRAAEAELAALAPDGLDRLRVEEARLQARHDEVARALDSLRGDKVASAVADRDRAVVMDSGGAVRRDLAGEVDCAEDVRPGDVRAGASMPTGRAPIDSGGPDPIETGEDGAIETGALEPGVAEAEAAEQAASHSLEQARESLHAAQLAVEKANTVRLAAEREHLAARVSLEAPDRAARVAAIGQALTDTRAEQASLAARVETLTAALADARVDILEQDVVRFRDSAEQLERQHAERREQLMRLEVELQTEGAAGDEEQRAGLVRDHAQAARRADELQRRAAALDLLLRLLDERRQALTRRLQAPLQKHLNRYLQLLFPQASLEIDENLTPGPLTRPAAHGAETGRFEALSFGAREQMGVISRLAYADLLAEAGRPTLIILDDALVHSDAERLAQMKRILFDAATRHQILLFTCHPANWRDLGVAARSLEGSRPG